MVAVAYDINSGIGIPLPMLFMATVFFVLLIPAMNDLVRGIERYSTGRTGASGQESGGNHE
jgi:hypothetical protein